MPPPRGTATILRVVDVTGKLVRVETPYGARDEVPVLELKLEDGRTFTLYYVPFDVVNAVNKMRRMRSEGSDEPGISSFTQRASLFELLIELPGARDALAAAVPLEQVVIDQFDPLSGLYTATAIFNLSGLRMKLTMIPSHAVYLAYILDKPIFVLSTLVDEQEEDRREEARLTHWIDEEDEEESGEEDEF